MDFSPSVEEDMLRDSARRALAGDFAARSGGEQGSGVAGAGWSVYAELGWLALLVPEDAGGLGGDIASALVLAEEMGRALSLRPFVSSGILAVRLVERVAEGAPRKALLDRMIEGKELLAPALYEPRRRYALEPSATTAAPREGGYRVTGAKCIVIGGRDTTGFLVTARMPGGEFGLFLIDAAAEGVSLARYPLLDDRDACDLNLARVFVPSDALLGCVAPGVLEDALDEARLAQCANTLGALQRAVELTAEYLKTRRQFGQPLSSFQALQHSLVEAHIETDFVRSSLYQAIAASGAGERDRRRKAVASCCVKTFDVAKSVAGAAVHLHGAIGVSSEYPVGHFLRRVMVSERTYGDLEHHLACYMKLPD